MKWIEVVLHFVIAPTTLELSHINPGGGGLPYESDGNARRKIIINTLKETNLGVAPALFNP